MVMIFKALFQIIVGGVLQCIECHIAGLKGLLVVREPDVTVECSKDLLWGVSIHRGEHANVIGIQGNSVGVTPALRAWYVENGRAKGVITILATVVDGTNWHVYVALIIFCKKLLSNFFQKNKKKRMSLTKKGVFHLFLFFLCDFLMFHHFTIFYFSSCAYFFICYQLIRNEAPTDPLHRQSAGGG